MDLVQSLLPVANSRLVTVASRAPLVEAAKRLNEKNSSLLVVCDDDGLMRGVITKSDVVREISHCQGCSCTVMVAQVMTPDVVCCEPDHSLDAVWSLMKQHRLRQMPVKSAELEPLGLLYASDVLEKLLNEASQTETLLRDYVMGIGYR